MYYAPINSLNIKCAFGSPMFTLHVRWRAISYLNQTHLELCTFPLSLILKVPTINTKMSEQQNSNKRKGSKPIAKASFKKAKIDDAATVPDTLQWTDYYPVDTKNMDTVITLFEKFNERRVKMLIQSNYTDSKLKKKLKDYLRKNRVRENLAKVEYTYSSHAYNESGRLFARGGVGLQSFPRDVRNFLCGPLVDDIDEVNSLPTITQHLFKRYNISCAELDEYVKDRAAVLKRERLDKQHVITMLNDSTKTPSNAFVAKIHQCIYETLVPTLQNIGDGYWATFWKHVQYVKRGDVNAEGAYFALVTQTIENQCLTAMREFMKSKNLEINTLIFDGFTVTKPTLLETKDILDDCVEYVAKKTGMKMPLAVKPMDVSEEFYKEHHIDKRGLELDEEDDDMSSEETERLKKTPVSASVTRDEELSLKKCSEIMTNTNEAVLIRYLNNFFAKVTEEDGVWIASRRTISSPWLLRKQNSFRAAIEHLKFPYLVEEYDDKGKLRLVEKTYVVACWMENVNMRTFRKVKFEPGHVGDKEGEYINLFEGFAGKEVDAIDMSLVQPLLDHFFNILSNKDVEVFDYIINWQAHIVQHPDKKMGTAIVINGKQGTGKNIGWDAIAKFVIGLAHSISTQNIDQLTGRFNAHSAKAIFILAQEVTFAGAHKQNQQLKSMITEDTVLLEKKGIDSIMVKSCSNYVFLSNMDDAVRVENGDRRYVVVESSDERKGDFEYFANLAKITDNQEAMNHYFTYLLKKDLSKFNPRKIPDTQTKRDMQTFTATPYELFITALLNGEILLTPEKQKYQQREEDEEGNIICKGGYEKVEAEYFVEGETYETNMGHMYKLYNGYCDENLKHCREMRLNPPAFGIQFRKTFEVTNTKSNRRNGTPISFFLKRK